MIKHFKDIYLNYDNFSNNDFKMNKIDESFLRNMSSIIIEGLRNKATKEYSTSHRRLDFDGCMVTICNIVTQFTLEEETKNWGGDFIINDFKDKMLDFYTKPFHKFMDCISKIAIGWFKGEIIEELNIAFEEHRFGYRLNNDESNPWVCINPDYNTSIDLQEVITTVEDLCKQTADHIRQYKEQIAKQNNLRARKDAVRDCLSAMESLMKKVTNTNSVSNANNYFIANNNLWGDKMVLTDGHKMWKHIQDTYPDVRHGNEDITDMSEEEALYYADRILIYVNYITLVAKKLIDSKDLYVK